MDTLRNLAAKEIDARIAEAEYAWMTAARDARAATEYIKMANSDDPRYLGWKHGLESNEKRLEKANAAMGWCREVIDACNKIYRERGCWKRYYLVTSSIGHVHRERYCSTCYPSTAYAWLTELSDCDEGAMVEAWGEKACTICFPNAPTHPAWKKSVEEREAEEAAKAAAKCPGSGSMVDRYWAKRYTNCPTCGYAASITKTGKIRGHKKRS